MTVAGRSWMGRLAAPVDAASVLVFRTAFGLLMAIELAAHVLGKKLHLLFTAPLFHFTYPGFAWVQPLPDGLLGLLVWLLLSMALLVAVGWRPRLFAGLLGVGLTYLFLLDSANYNNHNYLILLIAFLLAVVPIAHPAGGARAAGRGRPATLPAWGLWLLRLQVGIPYFFGGLAKVNRDWLLRAEPMHLWLSAGDTGGPLRLAVFDDLWFAFLLSWGGFLLDLLCVPLLLWRRTRAATFMLLVGFHLTNAFLFKIGVFPWLMIAATALFLEPSWPRRLRLLPSAAVAPSSANPRPLRVVSAAGLAIYVFLQLALPFRHFLYPGWVDWTEEGHRFAWRMKLRDKRGTVRFAAVDERTRRVNVLDGLDGILTSRQISMMEHDPEMMRQTARILARQMAAKGLGDVEVRAITSLSLNGRSPRPLIDPRVNLAAEQARWWTHAEWILPLEP